MGSVMGMLVQVGKAFLPKLFEGLVTTKAFISWASKHLLVMAVGGALTIGVLIYFELVKVNAPTAQKPAGPPLSLAAPAEPPAPVVAPAPVAPPVNAQVTELMQHLVALEAATNATAVDLKALKSSFWAMRQKLEAPPKKSSGLGLFGG